MTISINSKRIPPPPHQGTFNHRLTPAGLSLALFAASLLLTACPSPGGLKAENNCTGTDRYSITQKSPGSFKLTVKECVREIGNSEFSSSGTIITAAAASEGVDAGQMITEIALPSTLRSIGVSGFTGHGLLSGTLMIPQNVETLADEAFQNMALISSAPLAVVFETGSKLRSIGNYTFFQSRLKDFTLPENLETIEPFAFFSAAFSPPGTLIIPSKVSRIGNKAFGRVSGITAVDIRSDQLFKLDGAAGSFPLGNNLFQGVSGITEIKLSQRVYDSYTKAQLQVIFGSSFTNYRRPDGTPYDFASKP